MDDEELLEGGNASEAVVRVGATVRKPWAPSTPHVAAFMTALADAGIDMPRHFGRDDKGRQVIEFVPGLLAMHSARMTPAELARVGGMVRAIHDASSTYEPSSSAVWDTAIAAPGADLVCHNDLAPWNLITGDRWVFIDWDAAAPSTRLWTSLTPRTPSHCPTRRSNPTRQPTGCASSSMGMGRTGHSAISCRRR